MFWCFFTPWRIIFAQSSAIFPYMKTLMLLIWEHKLFESGGKKAKVIPITIPFPKHNSSGKRSTKQVDLQSKIFQLMYKQEMC